MSIIQKRLERLKVACCQWLFFKRQVDVLEVQCEQYAKSGQVNYIVPPFSVTIFLCLFESREDGKPSRVTHTYISSSNRTDNCTVGTLSVVLQYI